MALALILQLADALSALSTNVFSGFDQFEHILLDEVLAGFQAHLTKTSGAGLTYCKYSIT
jgi:hypothetical protein